MNIPVRYKVEVIADDSGEWCANGITYATKAEAEEAGDDLHMRWMAVREWRVVEVRQVDEQKVSR